MSLSVEKCDFFLKLFPSWNCYGQDANGFSSGLLVTWNPLKAQFSPFKTEARILVECRVKGLNMIIQILNNYGTYNHRKYLWDKVV